MTLSLEWILGILISSIISAIGWFVRLEVNNTKRDDKLFALEAKMEAFEALKLDARLTTIENDLKWIRAKLEEK